MMIGMLLFELAVLCTLGISGYGVFHFGELFASGIG